MVKVRKVITYGTYDMLHRGHVRLLERARELGDCLIVGVTSEDFDRQRGKVNVRQSLAERMEAVRATGLADEVIVEEYPGQKIDDIRRYGIDVFAIGSDWSGKFDYLNEWCRVVYLDRTEGVSSTEIRAAEGRLRLGLVGETGYARKLLRESSYVNGIEVVGVCAREPSLLASELSSLPLVTGDLDELLDRVDAVAIIAHPSAQAGIAERCIMAGAHVLCESPLALNVEGFDRLHALAEEGGVVLVEGLKTAYSTAYSRLVLLVKSGRIGRVLSVDATCTSTGGVDLSDHDDMARNWNAMTFWGPTAMLPVFQILGCGYESSRISTLWADEGLSFDAFSKIEFEYPGATASVKVGRGSKSEGELVVTGTEGYVYVPAPWWKTDYFELRFEDQNENKRYFYQLDGEGIRQELVSFQRAAEGQGTPYGIPLDVGRSIASVIGDFEARRGVRSL